MAPLSVRLGWHEEGRCATYLAVLGGATPRHVLDATSVAVFAPPGQLVFQREGVLMAQAFDPGSGRLKGQPRTLASDVGSPQMGSYNFSASGNGLLVCATGKRGRERLCWFDRSGRQMGEASGLPPPGSLYCLSPEGQQALYVADDPPGVARSCGW